MTSIVKQSAQILRVVITLSILLCTTACTKYWWTRGQPPSVETLVERSQVRFEETLAKRGSIRPSLAKIASELEKSLTTSYRFTQIQTSQSHLQLTEELKHSRNLFIDLEGELSVGSRAAYGELSGQVRKFLAKAEQGEKLTPETIGLFSARIGFFLANELEVPAPVSVS